MSNYPPNYPPGNPPPGGYPPGPPSGGYPPPPPGWQGSPPGYQGAPQGYPEPPKKGGALKWVLIGCGGVLVIGIIVVVVFVFWVKNKVDQVGVTAEMMEKQPTLAAAKLAVAFNSDLEIVSVDEGKGLITFKEKKTGKVFTVNASDTKGGQVTIKDDKGGSVEIKGDGSGGSINIKGDKGTVTLGSGGNASLPDWLPAYPGASIQGLYSTKSSEAETAGFTFTTSDSPEEVIDFYESALKSEDMRVTSSQTQQDGKNYSQVTGVDSDRNRTAFINAATEGGSTKVTIGYTIKH